MKINRVSIAILTIFVALAIYGQCIHRLMERLGEDAEMPGNWCIAMLALLLLCLVLFVAIISVWRQRAHLKVGATAAALCVALYDWHCIREFRNPWIEGFATYAKQKWNVEGLRDIVDVNARTLPKNKLVGLTKDQGTINGAFLLSGISPRIDVFIEDDGEQSIIMQWSMARYPIVGWALSKNKDFLEDSRHSSTWRVVGPNSIVYIRDIE
jgi:hypothetical protein